MRSNGPRHFHTHILSILLALYTLPSSIEYLLNQRVSPRTRRRWLTKETRPINLSSRYRDGGGDRFDSTAFSYLCSGRQKRVRTPEAWSRFHCLMHRWIHSCPTSILLREGECGVWRRLFSSSSSSFLLGGNARDRLTVGSNTRGRNRKGEEGGEGRIALGTSVVLAVLGYDFLRLFTGRFWNTRNPSFRCIFRFRGDGSLLSA